MIWDVVWVFLRVDGLISALFVGHYVGGLPR